MTSSGRLYALGDEPRDYEAARSVAYPGRIARPRLCARLMACELQRLIEDLGDCLTNFGLHSKDALPVWPLLQQLGTGLLYLDEGRVVRHRILQEIVSDLLTF